MTASAASAASSSSIPPSAPGSPSAPALLSSDQATELLDRVVYEQILECIDLDELFHLEQSLALTAGDMPGVTHERATELVRLTFDRAFRRLPDDIRNYLRAIDALTCQGCELCEEEAREAEAARDPRNIRSSPRPTGARRSIRIKS